MSQLGLLDITTIYLPKSCAKVAMDWMYARGLKKVEGVALWAGIKNGNIFYIKRTIIPEQKAGSLEDGLIYFVAAKELHRISLELFDNGIQLIGQIHSHPSEAYHSETDDAYPIVTVLGGISVVVPNFATGAIDLTDWAVYRFLPAIGWTELNQLEKDTLLHIVEDLPKSNPSDNPNIYK